MLVIPLILENLKSYHPYRCSLYCYHTVFVSAYRKKKTASSLRNVLQGESGIIGGCSEGTKHPIREAASELQDRVHTGYTCGDNRRNYKAPLVHSERYPSPTEVY